MNQRDTKFPTISVVTPSYNQGRFIEETIESVLSQEGDFYIEYFIMDGGSTDKSVEIIKKYEHLLRDGKWRLKCHGITYNWVSENDNGQADAVNKGFLLAHGEILGWLNSDDTYLPNAFSKVVTYINNHKDVMMVYGEGYHTNENGDIIERYYTEPFDFQRLSELCYICQPTVFIRKGVIDEVGMLNDKLHYCMDYDFWIRIGKELKIGYLPEYLANSRLYAETKTVSKRLDIHIEMLPTVKNHYGYVSNSWLKSYVRTYLGQWLNRDTKLFTLLAPLLFIYKSIQYNKTFPLSELKRQFSRLLKNHLKWAEK